MLCTSSKMYRQMHANTGIATDGARVQRSPMPDLAVPGERFEPSGN
jgi:hypothetical protein